MPEERQPGEHRDLAVAFADGLAGVVTFMGLIVITGWLFRIELLKTVVPGFTTMKVNTAVCMILLGAALLCFDGSGTHRRAISRVCAAAAVTIAGLTLAEYLFHIDLQIDNLLFVDATAISFPGRMAPASIGCFLAYGMALLRPGHRRWAWVSQVTMYAVVVASLATLGGYLYGAPQMLADAPYPVVALHTAAALAMLGVGGLLKQSGDGPMRILNANTMGGWVARRLVPTAGAIPLMAGLVVVTGQRMGVYGGAFSVALMVAADVGLMTGIVWWVAALLDHADAERVRVERVAEQTRQELLDAERLGRAEAERHGRLKDEFLATLSHELRTPLNAILGWSSILAGSGGVDHKTLEGLTVIERSARAQTHIIEDMLDMSRIISGKLRLEVQAVDLPRVIESAVQTVRPAANARGVEFRLDIDPNAGPVTGDPNRMQQIAWNLLSNAVKFTPRGGWVHVTLARAGVESAVELTVADSGQGIAPEFLPHLFERFRQADSSMTRRHGGLGLGLAIVKQLTELQGGTVRAESAGDGKGATFVVRLPLGETAAPVAVQAPAVFPPSPPMRKVTHCAPKGLQGARVLVVDDEPDARNLVEHILAEAKAEVVTVGSADEALAEIVVHDFDVLLSDIGMPGKDGFDLIKLLRARKGGRGSALPAAALTAFARAEDRTRALWAGYQLHVTKPVDPTELIAVVASLAGRELPADKTAA